MIRYTKISRHIGAFLRMKYNFLDASKAGWMGPFPKCVRRKGRSIWSLSQGIEARRAGKHGSKLLLPKRNRALAIGVGWLKLGELKSVTLGWGKGEAVFHTRVFFVFFLLELR